MDGNLLSSEIKQWHLVAVFNEISMKNNRIIEQGPHPKSGLHEELLQVAASAIASLIV